MVKLLFALKSYCPLFVKNDKFYDDQSLKSSNFDHKFMKHTHNVYHNLLV